MRRRRLLALALVLTGVALGGCSPSVTVVMPDPVACHEAPVRQGQPGPAFARTVCE